jgi:hypothetical protein
MDILILKDQQSHGPYNEEQLLELLRDGAISRSDLVYYDGMMDWTPLDQIFEVEEALTHSMDEGQEPSLVAEIFTEASSLISSHEQIFYIAHQKPRMLRQKPDSVVVTNERIIITRHGLSGSRTEDHQWKDILSVEMRENLMGTTFSMLDRADHVIQIDDLPKPQIEKLCRLAQEMRQQS